MTNRKLAYIVKDQKPLVLGLNETVQHACRLMGERRAGSVLIVDTEVRLRGIFTGRDAVRLLAKGSHVATTHLGQAMTPNPVTIALESRAIDALKAMNDGGFRHVPVTENGRISGIVSRGDFKGMEFDEFNWDGSPKQRVSRPIERSHLLSKTNSRLCLPQMKRFSEPASQCRKAGPAQFSS